MKFFIDTANLDEIREAASLGVLDGVTTNTTLLSREKGKGDFKDILKEICRIVQGPVSAEVVGKDADAMVAEARKLAKIDEHIVIKVPLLKEGLKVIDCRDRLIEWLEHGVDLLQFGNRRLGFVGIIPEVSLRHPGFKRSGRGGAASVVKESLAVGGAGRESRLHDERALYPCSRFYGQLSQKKKGPG